MVFVFRIPANNISDSVIPDVYHLNFMDKIRSHVVQMNLNP
jgi:hypothetical protein